jgi:hypothetical protein
LFRLAYCEVLRVEITYLDYWFMDIRKKMQPLFIPWGKKRRNQTWKLKGWEEKKRGKEKKKKKNRSLKPYQSYVATMRLIERKFMSRRFQRHQEKSSLKLKGSRISRLNAATFLTGWHVSYMLHTIFLKKISIWFLGNSSIQPWFYPIRTPIKIKTGRENRKGKERDRWPNRVSSSWLWP